MAMKNTSDYIEEHIKAILDQVSVAELRRSELASRFEVVPSQINYVIKTRFTASVAILLRVSVVVVVISELGGLPFRISTNWSMIC